MVTLKRYKRTESHQRNNTKSILEGYRSRGRIPWWKGKKRTSFSLSMRQMYKMGLRKPAMLGVVNEKSPNWKGDNVGYYGIHKWLLKYSKRTSYCQNCGNTKVKRFEWANVDGKYRRRLGDYKNLCPPCHRVLDGYNKITVTEVPKIKERIKNGEKQYFIAKEYRVCNATISNLINGKTKAYNV